MMRLRHRITFLPAPTILACAAFVVLLLAMPAGDLAALDKVEICHVTDDPGPGDGRVITVAATAWPTHEGHGDKPVGDPLVTVHGDGKSCHVASAPPIPAANILFSFETGTEGWREAGWLTSAGTVSQSTVFPTHGSFNLQVDANNGGWFGRGLATPRDLSGMSTLKVDVMTTSVATSSSVALQFGDGWDWCQSNLGSIPAGTVATIEVDLSTLGCPAPDLSQLQAIYVWFSSGGTYHMDFVRVE